MTDPTALPKAETVAERVRALEADCRRLAKTTIPQSPVVWEHLWDVRALTASAIAAELERLAGEMREIVDASDTPYWIAATALTAEWADQLAERKP